MRRSVVTVIAILLCQAAAAMSEMQPDSRPCSEKEVRMAMRTTSSLIGRLNSKSNIFTGLLVPKMNREARNTLRAMRRSDVTFNWDGCVIWDGHGRPMGARACALSPDSPCCMKDSAGNIRLWIRNVEVEYPDSTVMMADVRVKLNDKGWITGLDLVSENLYDLTASPDQTDRQIIECLSDRAGAMQTKLILNDISSVVNMYDGALSMSRKHSVTTRGAESCLKLMSEDRLIPYEVNISRSRAGRLYRVATKVYKASSDTPYGCEIVEFWDFENMENPRALVFAWIEGDEDTLKFSDFPFF